MWFVVTQNPSNEKLVFIDTDGADDGSKTEPATFATETEAREMAKHQPLCQAWGYEVYEY